MKYLFFSTKKFHFMLKWNRIVIWSVFHMIFIQNSVAEKSTGNSNGYCPPGDKYANQYISSPCFRPLGIEGEKSSESTVLRVSRVSSWGARVVKITITPENTQIERYVCSLGEQDNNGNSIYNIIDHSVKIVRNNEIKTNLNRQLVDPDLYHFFRETSTMKADSDDGVIDGSNMIVELLIGGKSEIIYIRGDQLSANWKKIPVVLSKGVLGVRGVDE